MKRTLKTAIGIALTLALIVTCILLFTSCQPKLPTEEELLAMEEPARAAALLEAFETKMNYIDSYTSKGVGTVKYEGATITTEITTKTKGATKGGYAINYSYLTHTPTSNGIKQTKWEEGYESGKAYIVPANSEDIIWSPMNSLQYYNYISDDDYFDFTKCYEGAATVTAKQNEDKSWTVTIKDFNEEWLDKLEDSIKSLKSLYSSTRRLSNATVTVCIDEELRITEYKLAYVFEKKAGVSKAVSISANQSIIYSDYDETTLEPKDFTNATKVESLSTQKKLIDSLDDVMKKKNGRIIVNSTVTAETAQKTEKQTAVDTLVFANGNDGLVYTLTTDIDGNTTTTEYSDRNLVIGGYDAGSSSDSEQRSALSLLVNPAGLSYTGYSNCVKGEVDGKTVYSFTLSDPDTTAYGSSALWVSKTATVKITVNSSGAATGYLYTLKLERSDVTVTQVINVQLIIENE